MKAILLIDMPKKCGDCKLFMNNGNSYWCVKTGYDTTSSSMPDNCLRPIPKKIEAPEIYELWNTDSEYIKGWNDCIDEILGGKEE